MIRATLLMSFGAIAGLIVFTGVVVAVWIEAVKIYNGRDE